MPFCVRKSPWLTGSLPSNRQRLPEHTRPSSGQWKPCVGRMARGRPGRCESLMREQCAGGEATKKREIPAQQKQGEIQVKIIALAAAVIVAAVVPASLFQQAT